MQSFLNSFKKIVEEKYIDINLTYDFLTQCKKVSIPVHFAGEWIIDNIYIVEEICESILKSLKSENINKLPMSKEHTKQKFPRIYYWAKEYLAKNSNNVDKDSVIREIEKYQTVAVFTFRELIHLPLMLNIAMLDNISNLCNDVLYSQHQKYKAYKLVSETVCTLTQGKYSNNGVINKIKKESQKQTSINSESIRNSYISVNLPYIESLTFRLKEVGRDGLKYFDILKEELNKRGISIEKCIEMEYVNSSKLKVFMANAFGSIKKIQYINWEDVFEATNRLDEILNEDFTDTYKYLDYGTKVEYRNKIIKISERTNFSEVYIAKKIVELSIREKKHVGWYVLKEGIYDLYKEIKFEYGIRKTMQKQWKTYRFEIYLISLIILTALTVYMTYDVSKSILVSLLLAMPIINTYQVILEFIITKTVKPRILPKIDIEKYPYSVPTCIINPVLLDSKEKLMDMIEKLEITYLANKNENISLLLLGDCLQSDRENIPIDSDIINIGRAEISRLNDIYYNDFNRNIFSMVYRKRLFNEKQDKWIGYERKRGAITDINRLLLGKYSQSQIDEKMYLLSEIPKKIRYVITLDEDTILPFDSGIKLIGTMEHPLNRPVYSMKNEKIKIIDGYALLQPRIGLDVQSSNKSTFSQMFGGMGGTDVYTLAISNFYFDAFDEGIFAGKGIYDLHAFEEVVSNHMPENKVLSHDLIEGSMLRAGYVSDIELLDGIPSKYISYSMRGHRWIRGDFQNSIFLKGKILSRLSKYKLLDNLKRAILSVVFILSIVLSVITANKYLILTTFILLNVRIWNKYNR